jgi:predicted RNase H-like HicB family nuclease
MFITVNVPVKALCHPIDGGGFWAEVKGLPGCVAQAETVDDLRKNLAQAVTDWLEEHPEKTEEEARLLARLQGESLSPGESYPEPYEYLPPAGWTEDDE